MSKYLYDALLKKKRESSGAEQNNNGEVALDDISRVKVLSPARKVFKRFMRNRLAVVGAIILICMFAFAFLGPLFYPYEQDQHFYKYDTQTINYSQAKRIVNYTGYKVDDGIKVDSEVETMMNSNVKGMIADGVESKFVLGADGAYTIDKIADSIYSLSKADSKLICSAGVHSVKLGVYSRGTKTFSPAPGEDIPEGFEDSLKNAKMTGSEGTVVIGGVEYTYKRGAQKTDLDIFRRIEGILYHSGEKGGDFEAVLTDAVENEKDFEFGGKTYSLVQNGDVFDVYELGSAKVAMVYTLYALNKVDLEKEFPDEVRVKALLAAGKGGEFKAEGKTYYLEKDEDDLIIKDSGKNVIADMSLISVRRYSGQDTMEYGLKRTVIKKIEEMDSTDTREGKFVYAIPRQDTETGQVVYDEDGKLVMDDSDLYINRSDTGVYNITCDQIIFLIDTYAPVSGTHILGTDGDGYDVFARVMYGGRISLLVGFVVVFLEIILGVIMGGLAGYYGKWVDMIIMRLVDIFYCIPSLPILIILGVLMDYQRLDPIPRLMVMMATLGILGWAGVARMVRGQILSLREQEFMVAAEATGIKVSTRIFKHLIPNVMPQLIVIATMGMGGVILTESTLSFLGLGVKHPLATWGTMINSVSDQTSIAKYPYIWIPVGLLICITVVAFNFVGDGLRDAYDPRSKK